MPEIPPFSARDLNRAPRLRRLAALVDEHAKWSSSSPAQARARVGLAVAMRLRAAELEAGYGQLTDFDKLLKQVRELGYGG